MRYFNHAFETTSVTGLLARFDGFPAGCDPDFDTDLESLEREFAELRLSFDHR